MFETAKLQKLYDITIFLCVFFIQFAYFVVILHR